MSLSYGYPPAGPSNSKPGAYDEWDARAFASYGYSSAYDFAPCGAYGETKSTCGITASGHGPYYSPYTSPEMVPFDDYEATSPISPSSSSASCSSCDAPNTPASYQQPALPPGGLLYTRFDPPIEEEEEEYMRDDAMMDDSEGPWEEEDLEEEDLTAAYCATTVPESRVDARYGAIPAQLDSYDASSPTYASSPYSPAEILAASPTHEPSSEQPPVSCLSPALLSCPAPLKLHQPQPKRSIPLISLSALASDASAVPAPASAPPQPGPPPFAHAHPVASPLSPLQLQLQFPPSATAARVVSSSCSPSSYAELSSTSDVFAYAAYPGSSPSRCLCSECAPRPASESYGHIIPISFAHP